MATSQRPEIPPIAPYYLWLNGAQAGPFTAREVMQRRGDGTINGTTPYWVEGMSEWTALGDFLTPKLPPSLPAVKRKTTSQFPPSVPAVKKKEMLSGGTVAAIVISVTIVFFLLIPSLASSLRNNSSHVQEPRAVAPSSAVPTLPSPVVQNSAWDGSVSQVVDYLQRNAKDPDSVKCSDWTKVVSNDDGFLVACTVRAKNSYGGNDMFMGVFSLNASGKVLQMERHAASMNPAR